MKSTTTILALLLSTASFSQVKTAAELQITVDSLSQIITEVQQDLSITQSEAAYNAREAINHMSKVKELERELQELKATLKKDRDEAHNLAEEAEIHFQRAENLKARLEECLKKNE